MRRFLSLAGFLLALGSGLVLSQPRAQFSKFIFPTPAAGGGYTGPADVIASPVAWWGLRAMSAADRGNKLVNVCNVSDVACVDMVSDATTGALVVTTVGGSSCGSITCTIKTWYDRSGNTHDLTQATIANRSQLVPSCFTLTSVCATFIFTAPTSYTASSVPATQPIFTSTVIDRTANASAANTIFWNNTGGVGEFFTASANTGELAAGSTPTFTISDSNLHAFQGYINGASSVANVDSTETSSLSAGANTMTGSMLVGIDGFGDQFNGVLTELGIWSATTTTTTTRNNMCHNQFAFWGTVTSC